MTGQENDPRDIAAKKAIDEYAAEDLPRIKTRADKWIAGLAAIAGVLTTAALIKGPDTLTKVSDASFLKSIGPRDLVVALLALGGIALGYGIYEGYRSANGSPLGDNEMSKIANEHAPNIPGLADRWTKAVSSEARNSTDALGRAVISTVVGIALLAGALVYASYNPTPATADTPTCVRIGNATVEFDGALPAITSGSATIVACPKT
jgi:hypothetical protein